MKHQRLFFWLIIWAVLIDVSLQIKYSKKDKCDNLKIIYLYYRKLNLRCLQGKTIYDKNNAPRWFC
jgi:hypothetical protein